MSQESYEGEWKDDQRHGSGVYIFPNGDKYVGNFVHNTRDGEGKLHWFGGSNSINVNNINNADIPNNANNAGAVEGGDGKIIVGTWDKGKLVRAFEDTDGSDGSDRGDGDGDDGGDNRDDKHKEDKGDKGKGKGKGKGKELSLNVMPYKEGEVISSNKILSTYKVVYHGGVNIRAIPDVDGERLGVLEFGKEIEVQDSCVVGGRNPITFLKVVAGERDGWVVLELRGIEVMRLVKGAVGGTAGFGFEVKTEVPKIQMQTQIQSPGCSNCKAETHCIYECPFIRPTTQ